MLAATVTVRSPLPPPVTAPLPMSRALLPVKVKSPFQFWAILFVKTIGEPLVLSSVPPLITTAPVPKAVAVLTLSVPALSVVPPL